MSEDIKVIEEIKDVVPVVPYADFTMKDLELIYNFKEAGLLGLHTLTDVDVERFMGLYLDGKTYRQIANLTKKNKSIILYLADKFKWFELRKDYLEELQTTLKDKIVESKLQSQEFFLELILAYQKKVSKNIHKYLRTDNEEFADNVDIKDINTILKVTELLHKLSSENLGTPEGNKSLVGLNGLGEGVTITKTGANSVEITPNKSPFSNKLKQFADLKREQERNPEGAPKAAHDITAENPNNKESEENENK